MVVDSRVPCVLLTLLTIVPLSRATYEQLVLEKSEYELPSLPFEFGDLEPYLDEATLKVHLQGHHATYTNNMNTALASWRSQFPDDKLANRSILHILRNVEDVPHEFSTAIHNQGGGYLNHCFYWATMSANPAGDERRPQGRLLIDIQREFGSYEQFLDAFTEKARTLFGSGYVWLSRSQSGDLELTTTVNQESPVSEALRPLLTLDVWEHSYYLKFQFRRLNYVENWWKVVDWKAVEQLDTWWYKLEKLHNDEL